MFSGVDPVMLPRAELDSAELRGSGGVQALSWVGGFSAMVRGRGLTALDRGIGDDNDPNFIGPRFDPNSSPSFTFRGDTRSPDVIFNEGFQPRGDSTDLFLHALDNTNPPSIYV
jgi:hypothetical protein